MVDRKADLTPALLGDGHACETLCVDAGIHLCPIAGICNGGHVGKQISGPARLLYRDHGSIQCKTLNPRVYVWDKFPW